MEFVPTLVVLFCFGLCNVWCQTDTTGSYGNPDVYSQAQTLEFLNIVSTTCNGCLNDFCLILVKAEGNYAEKREICQWLTEGDGSPQFFKYRDSLEKLEALWPIPSGDDVVDKTPFLVGGAWCPRVEGLPQNQAETIFWTSTNVELPEWMNSVNRNISADGVPCLFLAARRALQNVFELSFVDDNVTDLVLCVTECLTQCSSGDGSSTSDQSYGTHTSTEDVQTDGTTGVGVTTDDLAKTGETDPVSYKPPFTTETKSDTTTSLTGKTDSTRDTSQYSTDGTVRTTNQTTEDTDGTTRHSISTVDSSSMTRDSSTTEFSRSTTGDGSTAEVSSTIRYSSSTTRVTTITQDSSTKQDTSRTTGDNATIGYSSTTLNDKQTTARPPTVSKCSEREFDGLVFVSVSRGETAYANCSEGHEGIVSWTCGRNGEFEPKTPLFNCTPAWLEDLKDKMKNMSSMDGANLLHNVTSDNVLWYGPAIAGVLDLLADVKNKFFGSSNTIHEVRNFSQAVLGVASNVLKRDNSDGWNRIQKKETMRSNFGKVLGIVEDLGKELLCSCNETLTLSRYTSTDHLNSDNILLEVLPVNKNGSTVFTPVDKDKGCQVVLPMQDVDLPPSCFHAAVGVYYKSLDGPGGLLANVTFNDDEDEMNGSKVLNSPVVALSLPTVALRQHYSLKTPVTLILPKSHINTVSNHDCVFWDYYSSQWNNQGCVLTKSNDTHLFCECDHLTNFAVLMTINREVNNLSFLFPSDVFYYLLFLVVVICTVLV